MTTKNTPYAPFQDVRGFFLSSNELTGTTCLCRDADQHLPAPLNIPIQPGGYIPKGGLLFWDVLANRAKDKHVLDLGAGQTGILSVFASVNGARKVDAVDIDPSCTSWLRQVKDNLGYNRIDVREGNLFDAVSPAQQYDLILSNPPQMPMTKGHVHDSGGPDGRAVVEQIIKEAPHHLAKGGQLYCLLFNFLGIHNQTGTKPALSEYAVAHGFKNVTTIKDVPVDIKPGSVTENNLPYIKSIYPNYNFQGSQGQAQHAISVVQFSM